MNGGAWFRLISLFMSLSAACVLGRALLRQDCLCERLERKILEPKFRQKLGTLLPTPRHLLHLRKGLADLR